MIGKVAEKKTPKGKYSFKIFFDKFFPGCQLSKTEDTDTKIPEKMAIAYYRQYLKSGLSFKQFDKEMGIS